MVFADNKLGVRSTQCSLNSSKANIRAFGIHQIEAIAPREHDAYVVCFIDHPGNSFLFCIREVWGSTVMIRFGSIAVRCWVVLPMVFAEQKRDRSIQCAPSSSQANAGAFSVHQILAIETREHEACVFCFTDPLGNSFLCGISRHVKG